MYLLHEIITLVLKILSLLIQLKKMQWESLMKLSRWLKLHCQKKILFLEPHTQMAGNRRYTSAEKGQLTEQS